MCNAYSQKTVGMLFAWNMKRIELIAKENKKSALCFALLDYGLVLKVALDPHDQNQGLTLLVL